MGFHYSTFQNFDFLKVPYFCRINSGPIFYMSQSFFWPNHYKKPVFMFMRNYKDFFSFFDLMDLTIWEGCDEVKNSMGLLQGPRLMAWTTKSPIRGNHWVPLGCRALLGSVKSNLVNILLLA